ncbi:MAG: hypothetical protein R2850_06265 [Bacteroidia bacterium]
MRYLIILFFLRYFKEPKLAPNKLKDEKFRDTTLTKWCDENLSKDLNQNCTYILSYDNNYRIVQYVFSGCTTCKNHPYVLNIQYNSEDKPVRFVYFYGSDRVVSAEDLAGTNPLRPILMEYLFSYSENGELVELRKFDSGKMSRLIRKRDD